MVKVMPCTAVIRGFVSRRPRLNGSTGSTVWHARAARRRRSGLFREEQRHLETGGGVIAGEGQDSDEQVGVVVEAGERVGQFVADLRGERVLLLDPVDRDHQDVIVDDLGADLAVRVAGRGVDLI